MSISLLRIKSLTFIKRNDRIQLKKDIECSILQEYLQNGDGTAKTAHNRNYKQSEHIDIPKL